MINKEHKPLNIQLGPRKMTAEEHADLEVTFAKLSGFVKMMTGVANGCALLVMKDALDKIADVRPRSEYEVSPRRPHPNYRFKVKALFSKSFDDVVHYRTRLMHPASGDVRFFHVDDMPDYARKKYGALTDQQYFEFWESTGAGVYRECLPLVTSLWNKYRLSLAGHGVPHADKAAWGITAQTCLELAVGTWESTMLSVEEALEGRLTRDFVRRTFRPFLLKPVADRWQQALILLSPETATYKLDASEEHNIELGILQLRERWVSTDLPFNATMQAVEDYDEDIFRTRGEARKALRELADLRRDAEEDFRRARQDELSRKT